MRDANLELQPQLERDHAGRAIAAQTDAEQSGRGRGGVGERSEPGLGGRFSRNAGKHHARKSEIGVVEHVEELCVEPQPHTLGQGKRFRKVKITPRKIGTA